MKIRKSFFIIVILAIMSVFFLTACVDIGVNFTINFESNGGTACSSIKADGTKSVKMPKNPTKDNFKFDGWYWDDDVWNEPFTINSILDKPVSDTMVLTVYAKWVSTDTKIDFDSNGGSTVGSIIQQPDTSITKPDNPTKTGYSLQRWELNGQEFIFSKMPNENITIKAVWIANTYVLTYDYDGATGGNSVSQKDVTYDSAVGTLPTPTKTNYDFGGWFTGSNGTETQIISSYIWKFTEGQTIHAKWIGQQKTINFNYEGATSSNTQSSKTVIFNQAVGTLPTPAKTGNTFDGWYTQAGGAGTKYDSETIYSSSGTVALYAKWTANMYTLSFNLGGGQGSNSNKTVIFGATYGDLPTLTRDGFRLIGWQNERLQIVTKDSVVNIASNHHLSPVWEVHYQSSSDGKVTILESEKIRISAYNHKHDIIVFSNIDLYWEPMWQPNFRNTTNVIKILDSDQKIISNFTLPDATCFDTDGDLLVIGMGKLEQIRFYNITDGSFVKTISVAVPVYNVIIDDDVVIYSAQNQHIYDIYWLYLQTDTTITTSTSSIYYPCFSINRVDKILYIAEQNSSSCDLIYYNITTRSQIFHSSFGLYYGNIGPAAFDGTYVRYYGYKFDRLTGSRINSEHSYNSNGFTSTSILFDNNNYVLALGNTSQSTSDSLNAKVTSIALFDSSGLLYSFAFDTYGYMPTGDGKFVFYAHEGYIAFFDLNA